MTENFKSPKEYLEYVASGKWVFCELYHKRYRLLENGKIECNMIGSDHANRIIDISPQDFSLFSPYTPPKKKVKLWQFVSALGMTSSYFYTEDLTKFWNGETLEPTRQNTARWLRTSNFVEVEIEGEE